MKRRHFMQGIAASGAALAFPAVVTGQSQYKAEYKLSTVVGTAFPWGKGAEQWINLVKKKTAGRINIKLYPGVSLVQGDQTREFSAVRQGIIDLAIGSTINWSPQIKELNLFSLPFLMPDFAAVDSLTQGEIGKRMFGLMDKGGVVPLAWGENGFRELTNSKREVRTPADMKGLKVRIAGSALFSETFTDLGANPTQMSWADAQPAFASGAVDGQENPMTIFTAAKLHTLGHKFCTLWGYVCDPLAFVVNREVWNSWTAQDRDIVRDAAIAAAKFEIDLARKGITKSDDSVYKQVEGFGVKLTRPDAKEREQFVIATRRVYARWKAQTGKELVDIAEQAIAKRKIS